MLTSGPPRTTAEAFGAEMTAPPASFKQRSERPDLNDTDHARNVLHP